MERLKGRWRVGLLGIGALCLMLAGPPIAQADQTPYMDGVWRKLGRGVANIGTGPLEILRTPALVGRADGYISAMTVGMLQGAWRVLLREVTGVFEIVTFAVEIPDNFAPLMKPEFVWAHGNWAE